MAALDGSDGGYYFDENGNLVPVGGPAPAPQAPTVNSRLAALVAAHGGSALDPNTDLTPLWDRSLGSHGAYVNSKGQVLYNGGDSANQYWVPQGDWAFMAPPSHHDQWQQADSYDPRAMISEMPGLPIMLAPLGAAAAGGAAGVGAGEGLGLAAGEGGAMATGTGVAADGSAAAAGAGAGAGAGDLYGSSTGTAMGDAGNDTFGSSMNNADATGAFDQGGSAGVFDSQGNPLYSGSGSTLSDWLGYGKQGLDFANQYKGLIGAGLGALAGKAGGSKPAGNTTTTTTGDPAIMPYIQGNLAGAYNTLQGINPNNPLLPASQNEAMKTIRGDYLNPNSNPYFAQSVNDALGQAASTYAGYYGGAAGLNMGNSGFQEGLARGLGAAATNAYSQNYQTERGRQATMAAGAPQLVSQSNAAMFSPNQSFAGLIPGFTSTSVPYFQNNLGNMMSGALGGYALSKAAG